MRNLKENAVLLLNNKAAHLPKVNGFNVPDDILFIKALQVSPSCKALPHLSE
jgi:hypothetical protein